MHVGKTVIAAAILSIAAPLILVTVASAASGDAEYRAKISRYGDSLIKQQAAMQTGESSLPRVEEYLNTVLWYVYTGKILANKQFDETVNESNSDLQVLVDQGYLPFWPGNPLNNWAPIKVLSSADNFSAGDLCFSLCPDSYSSFIKPNGLARLSFDLYIYSPDIALATFGSFSLGRNKEWDTPPAGALYGLAFFAMPEREYQDNLRKLKEQQAQKPK